MQTAKAQKLLVCYVPGLDLRRIDDTNAPFLSASFRTRPFAELDGLPSSELLSTFVTGTLPHEHGIWQTRLRPRRALTRRERLVDSLSDFMTTTSQCVRHQLRGDCDVPTLPPWRRRRFEMHRLKFHGRRVTSDLLAALEGVPTLLDAVGREQVRYIFTDRMHDRERLLSDVGSGAATLELVQFHAMDNLGHWRLETPEEFRHYYSLTDTFLAELHARCEKNGVTMVVLSDHGQEPVTGSHDLARDIRGLDVPRDEFAYFLQAAMARFWFHTPRARRAVLDLLARTPSGAVLHNEDLSRYGIEFPDDAFGAVYFVANPGVTFFPDDFHHPFVNVVMGLRDWQQRKRLRRHRHVAYHGYLPEHPSERGFLLVLDDRFPLERPRFHLLDVAPSLLRMLGRDAPAFMRGVARTPAFTGR